MDMHEAGVSSDRCVLSGASLPTNLPSADLTVKWFCFRWVCWEESRVLVVLVLYGAGEDGRLVENQPNLKNKKTDHRKQDFLHYKWQNEIESHGKMHLFALSTKTAIYSSWLIIS